MPEFVERAAANGSWSGPRRWLRDKNLSREFWIFFTAAFFFDFGFAVYFFLFNLYLLDLHFNERSIGFVTSALTLGSLVGTLPAGLLAKRFGLRPLLIVCFVAAPVFGVLRAVTVWQPAQIALAFIAGVAMCLWGVCFLPAVAGLTTPENRAAGFGLIFSTSIGTSALGGVVCGYLPAWLKSAGFSLEPFQVKRLILVMSCLLATVGLAAIVKLRLPSNAEAEAAEGNPSRWKIDPFLLRFLPSMALWTAVIAAFTPYANVYLSRELHLPMLRIGLIFSAGQVVQFCAGLLTPVLFRRLGLVNGIVTTQVISGVAMGWLASTQNQSVAVALFLGFSAMQWMSSPGLYNLLMSRVHEHERSTAAAMTMFCNALLGSASTAAAGYLFVRFGYPHVLGGIALLAFTAATVFRITVGNSNEPQLATADQQISTH